LGAAARVGCGQRKGSMGDASVVRRDPYQVLGVVRDVDGEGLKKAYRRLARQYHPDQNPDDPQAVGCFREVVEAYALLSDPGKRAAYDRHGRPGTVPPATSAVEIAESVRDVVGGWLGDLLGAEKKTQRGRDLSYTLTLSFAEAMLGCERTITFESPVQCPACAGDGTAPGAPGATVQCRRCEGSGRVTAGPAILGVSRTCGLCGGKGKRVGRPCETCGGAGTIKKTKYFSVKVPPCTEDGTVRMVRGHGAPGRNGGPPGDLQVLLRVKPHPLLRRKGNKIVCEVVASWKEAALGGAIAVPTLDGVVEMTLPPATRSGRTFLLEGCGMWHGEHRGTQEVTVIVETPQKLDGEQRDLLVGLDAKLRPEQTPLKRAYKAKLKEVEG
jgi:molecular chaperone DnaJ